MKILFLNPPFIRNFSRDSRSPEVSKGGCLYYPYYLAYCCGLLEEAGYDVKFIDGVASDLNSYQVSEIARRWDADLVVMNTSTPSIENDLKIAKTLLDSSFVVLVGTHPTALPEDVLNELDSVNAIVAKGEYDYTVRDIADAIKNKKDWTKIKGISWINGDKIIHNQNRELIENLDELPFVSKTYQKHLDIKKYSYPAVRYPQVTILTARGCSFCCQYCLYANTFWHGSYRFRSISNVLDELKWIEDNLDVKEVMFEDDTFSSVYTKERVMDFCREKIRRGIKIGWVANSRADADLETLEMMKKAGCRELCVGFESSEQPILNNIPKGLTIEQSKKFVENAKKVGIAIHGCFIVGLPDETKEIVDKTIDFALELNTDTIQVYPMMIYPGTKSFEWAEKNGYLKTKDWNEWLKKDGTHNTIVDRPDLSADYLVGKCDEALSKFYFRPKKIFSIMWSSLKSWQDAKRYYRGFKSFITYIIKGR